MSELSTPNQGRWEAEGILPRPEDIPFDWDYSSNTRTLEVRTKPDNQYGIGNVLLWVEADPYEYYDIVLAMTIAYQMGVKGQADYPMNR